jgi:hypothetical protein
MSGIGQVKDEFDGVVTSIPSVTIEPNEETIQLDDAGSGITYVGYAPIGTATSAAGWKIKRLDESGDPELIILFADGDANYDNVWDNRAALSYS